MGQKRTSAHVRVMSAFPPKADIEMPLGKGNCRHEKLACEDIKELAATDGFLATASER